MFLIEATNDRCVSNPLIKYITLCVPVSHLMSIMYLGAWHASRGNL